VNACFKGEQHVTATIDIYYEKFGWMLCWLDVVTVPFVFPLQAYYLYKIGPFEHSLWFTILVASTHFLGYYIFDTANSQKDFFRAGDTKYKPSGFPNLDSWGGRLTEPKFMNTKRGRKLLLDGWWVVSRHMNYTGDLMMAWSWAFTCGFPPSSIFPFIYTAYLTPLLFHRERRDHRNCKEKVVSCL